MPTTTCVFPGLRALALAAGASLAITACNPTAPADPAADTQAATVTDAPEALDGDRGQQAVVELDAATRSTATTGPAECSLDAINGDRITSGVAIPMGTPPMLEVSGWLVDRASMSRPPVSVRLTQVEGGRAWEVDAGAGVTRSDVATHFKDPGVANAGVNVTADLSMLPAGEYTVMLIHRKGDMLLTCERGARVRIAD